MNSKRQAEREEQQRIKSLVLNYDLRDGEDQDGDNISLSPIPPNYNIKTNDTGLERLTVAPNVKLDKSGNNRSGHRARKLQLSDVDWYGENSPKTTTSDKNAGSRKNPSDESTATSTSLFSSGKSSSSASTALEKDAPVFGLKEPLNSGPATTSRGAFAQRGSGYRGRGLGRGIGRGRGRGQSRGGQQQSTRRSVSSQQQENQKKANDDPYDGF